jgi:hypothetical protein
MLPEVALLEIFDCYLGEDPGIDELEEWHTLVHVCRKWRSVVFGSPHRLNLQLHCGTWKPVREMLDIWPSLPIVIWDWRPTRAVHNIVAALEHNDRVTQIELGGVPSSLLDKVLAVMQVPFLALTSLQLWSKDDDQPPVVPDSFLGGSAPRLRYLDLNRLSFLGLPRLLLSATDLVTLHLLDVPHSGYIPPNAIVAALSALTGLESFDLRFQSPRSCPDRKSRRPPPSAPFVLPALTYFNFKRIGDYLEDIVAWVDAPRLDCFHITFFHQLIFDTPQLAQFISRTPNLRAHDEAHLSFNDFAVVVFYKELELGISCTKSDWQLSSLAQICSSSLPLISSLEHLYIKDKYSQLRWQDNTESVQWLELLHQFTALKGLYLSQEIAPYIAPALQELVKERETEVLPALQSLFLEELHPLGPVQEAIGQFVDARQLSSHPIAVSQWDREEDKL